MSQDATDLDSLETVSRAEAGASMRLKDPASGKPLAGVLVVRGYDSETYKALVNEQQRRRLDRIRAQDERPTPEDLDADALELDCALVVGWSGLNVGGRPFEYSGANVRTLFARWPWIREQVGAFAAQRGHFLSGSAAA